MFKSNRKIYCSAGLSYILLLPNGDAYRCMADYNARRSPLFNAKDGWTPLERPELCTHQRCYAHCDVDWATKWIFEDGKAEPLVVRANCINDEFIGSYEKRVHIDQTFERPFQGDAFIAWLPSLVCNYTCNYCGSAAGVFKYEKFPSSLPELSCESWTSVMEEILSNYDSISLVVSGGEPLLSEATVPIIEMVSKRFKVNICTNLSVDPAGLAESGITPQGSPDLERGLRITATLHPTSKNFDEGKFFDSLLYLKEKGFLVRAAFVGHPLQLSMAEEYKKRCEEYGIHFFLLPWCGSDNDGVIASYTEAEREHFNRLTPSYRNMRTQTDLFSPSYTLKTSCDEVRLKQGESFVLRGEVLNTGDVTWLNKDRNEEDSFKVGGRVMREEGNKGALREFRGSLPDADIAPGDSSGFELTIDSAELKKGRYTLKLDMVKEGSLWFEEMGARPKRLGLTII
ncbi:MAG: hypothetical protein V3W31_09295 [Thermodesulfobacteriota bacterium]